MNFIIFVHDQKYCSESIVGDIYFHNKLSDRSLVYKNRSRGNLKEVESIMAGVVKLQGVLLDQVNQWNSNV